MKPEELPYFLSNNEVTNLDNVERWGTHNRIHKETVSQHTHWVSFITLVILENFGRDLLKDSNQNFHNFYTHCLVYSITHDISEAWTGDIPHTIKYKFSNSKSLRNALDAAEKKAVNEWRYGAFDFDFNFPLPHHMENREVKTTVKIADWLSCYMFAVREIEMGNEKGSSFRDVIRSVRGGLFDLSEKIMNERINLDAHIVSVIANNIKI